MLLSELISENSNATEHDTASTCQVCAASLPLVVIYCHSLCIFLSLKHEAIRAELREKQEDMDQLISTVEDLQRELEKIPKSDANSIQREMELLRDQWLEVGDT